MEPASIEYQVTIEDMVAFHADFRESSAIFRRTLRWHQIFLWCCTASVVPIILMGFRDDSNFIVALGVGLGSLLTLFTLDYAKRVARSNAAAIRRSFTDGANPGIIGWRRLSIGADGLIEESEIGQGVLRYSANQRISETPDRLFVYVGSLHAVVIAKQRIQSGDLDEFKTALQARLDKR